MKHISSASFFAPIWTVEEEVRRRYAELALTLPYAQLRAHAKAKLSSNPHWSIASIGPVLPRFFESHVKSTLPLGTRKQTTMAKRTAALIDELEQAATWCALAAAPVPKSLRAVLDDATLHCRRFDEIKASNDQVTQL
ncbi:hypothetical protein [Variovorax paradoxus]|uniref:hypothetical protein n=1 Tax=Variovorax paradoxus TaxID=34073 RepID=UPI003ECD46F2